MNDLLKHISGTLHRAYDSVVRLPMSWRMIDKLASLEEAEEARAARRAVSDPEPGPPGDPPQQDAHKP